MAFSDTDIFIVLTDLFSGPGRAIDMCLCVYVRTITFELDDLYNL